MQRKLIFETLEPRLLLSADLAPVEGVLEVFGTNESDFAFITARHERLLVELNGKAHEFALEDVQEIRVDLGDGDNRFEADLLNPVGLLSVVAGSGNDTLLVHARWDAASVDAHPDFLWVPTFNPGAGDDTVHAHWSSVDGFSFGEGLARVDARILAGDGNDTLSFDLSRLTVGVTRAPVVLLGLDGGLGDDIVRVTSPTASEGGTDPEPIDPAERRAPLRVGVDTGAGNDQVLGRVLLDADWNVQLGDGDDVTDIETLIGDVFAEAHYRIDAGEGDNETTLRFGDGERGARPPSGATNVTAEYRSGSGDDSVHFDWLVHLDRQLDIDLDALTGAGDDLVVASWKNQHESRTGKAVLWDYNFETGTGEDIVELRVAPGEGVDALGTEVEVSSDPDELGRIKVKFPFLGDESSSGEARLDSSDKLRLQTGSGDDTVAAKYTLFLPDGTPLRAKVDLEVLTGEGDDSIRAEVLGGDEVTIDVDAQGGNDSIWMDLGHPGTGINDGSSNTILVSEIRGGAGDDLLNVALSGASGGMDLVIDAGDGDDTVMFNPEEYTLTKDVDWSTRIDTGDGDDNLIVQTTAVRLGAQSRVEWVYDLGAGDDDVTHIRANWEIEEGVQYDWTVDLGDGDDAFRAQIVGQTIGDAAQVGYGFFGGAGDDLFAIEIKELIIKADVTYRSQVDAGDGADVVSHELTHVVQQGGASPNQKPVVTIDIDLGTGADGLRVDWRGPVQDPATDVRVDLRIAAGGADAILPEAGDEVLVTFMSGDPDRPFVLGTVWNSQDAPEDDKRLDMSLIGTSGGLAVSSAITGGAARDEVRLSVDGLVGPKTHINTRVDLGAGADALAVDLTGLERKGPKWLAPLRLDLHGGSGQDTLAVIGTAGNDRILLTPRAMLLAGAAHVNFAGFESVQVHAGDGNDRVWLLGRSPRIDWLVDGGAGHDRFFAPFGGRGDNVTLFDFENPILKKKKR